LYGKDETFKVGIPVLMDIPLIGLAFGRSQQKTNELELLVLVTPEIVEPMDPHEVPTCLPGMSSDVPNDCEMYLERKIEVPRHHGRDCGPDGNMAPQQRMEQLPPGEPVIINDQAIRRVPSKPVTKMPATNGKSPAQVAAKPPASKPTSKAPIAKPAKAKAEVAKTTPPTAGTTATTKPNRAKSSSSNKPSQTATAKDQSPGPAFIGPTGYDVLN
jgi:pilus assembly protein CpaC